MQNFEVRSCLRGEILSLGGGGKKPVIWEVRFVRIKKNQYRDFWSNQGKPNA